MSIIRKMAQANDDSDFVERQFEREEQRKRREAEFQAGCTLWLLHNRVITAQMSKPEKMKAMAVYRARLLKARPIAETEPRAWAYEILSKIADGEIVSPVQEQMAREVTGIWREEREAA